MFRDILSILTLGIIGKCNKKKNSKPWYLRLLDKNDTTIALSSILVLGMLLVGLILLTVPIFILIIEAWYNHTIATDLNGLSAYIAACVSMFVTAGATKIGVQWTDAKRYKEINDNSEKNEDEIITD